MADEEKKEQAAESKPAEAEAKTEEKAEVPAKFRPLVEEIEKLSALELSELVKVLEDRFGVSAAAPMAVAAPGAAGGGEGGAAEEKDNFDIELSDTGSNKIAVIKVVKEVTGKGLKDAKDMVEGAPVVVKEGVPKAEADELKAKLEEAGAKVTLK